DPVVEGDQAEVVGRVEPVDEPLQSQLRPVEAGSGHGAAAVEYHLERARRPRCAVVVLSGGGRRRPLDEARDPVLRPRRYDVAIQVGVEVPGPPLPLVAWPRRPPALAQKVQGRSGPPIACGIPQRTDAICQLGTPPGSTGVMR